MNKDGIWIEKNINIKNIPKSCVHIPNICFICMNYKIFIVCNRCGAINTCENSLNIKISPRCYICFYDIRNNEFFNHISLFQPF